MTSKRRSQETEQEATNRRKQYFSRAIRTSFSIGLVAEMPTPFFGSEIPAHSCARFREQVFRPPSPDAHNPVPTCRSQQFRIRVEHRTVNRIRMGKNRDFTRAGDFPDSRGVIFAARYDVATVRAERNTVDISVVRKADGFLADREFPEPGVATKPSSGKIFVVRRL